MDAAPTSVARSRGAVSPREERRQRLQELSRLQLLDAAERVFAEKGFESAAVKEIADQAELSVGSVYQLFKNKQAMFRAVFTRRNQEGLAVLQAAIGSTESPLDQLHRLIDATLDYYTEHRTFYLLFQHAIGGSWLNVKAGFDTRNFEEYLQYVGLPAEIFARGREAGVFLPMDPQGMAVMYTGILQAYLLHEVIGVDHEPSEEHTEITRHDLHTLMDRAFSAPS